MTDGFRLNTKKAVFTYSKCPLSKETVYNHINAKYPIKYARICIEAHADGTPHLHAAIEWKKKINITNSRTFDIDGFHANVAPPMSWPASKNYVKKGDNFKDWDNNDEVEEDSNIYKLAEELDMPKFFEFCRKRKVPYAYADRAWKHKESIFTIIDSPTEGSIRPSLDRLTIDETDRRSLVITGPSGFGKTTWALKNCQKPSLFVTHMDTLREFRAGFHKSIIFDDMSFKHLPRESQIQLVDREQSRSIHIRYGTARIPAGIQKIFTSNVPIFDTTEEAIARRINLIKFISF